jgi:hypothetical protein
VLVFRQGKVFGGNDRVYITGDFHSSGDRIDGNLQITYYAGDPLGIFGLIDVNQAEGMLISGHCSEDEIQVKGTLERNSQLILQGVLLKKAGREIF